MRIDRLILQAFGPFSNHTLELSKGGAGFHIVFGPNEAGKSSALRAITQMFYGIPTRSSDDFLHKKSTMRIGAEISDGKNRLHFIRRKGKKSTLRDGQDVESIDEAELQVFLDGLDEDTFSTVFGLHHEQLVKGGREILEGEGNIGQSLFATSAGLSGLRSVMKSLQEEVGELFKPSGSKPKINATISNFKKKKKELKDLQLRSGDWTDVNDKLTAAYSNRKEIEEAINDLSVKRNRLERIAKAIPLAKKREIILLRVAPVAEAILLPEDFHERRITLLQEQGQVLSQNQVAQQHLERITSSESDLCINENLVEQQKLVERLYQRLGTNNKALDDSRRKLQPKRCLLEEQIQKSLAVLRPEWKQDQIETLRISTSKRNHIQELSQKRDTLDTHRKHAQEKLAVLEMEKKQVAVKLSEIGNASDPIKLDQSIRRTQRYGDQEEQLNTNQQEQDITEREINSALSRLELWVGTAEELEKLPVPSQETSNDFKECMDQQEGRIEELKLRCVELEESQRVTQEKIEILKREQDVPTEETLGIMRSTRNNTWKLVRGAWETQRLPEDVDSETIDILSKNLEIPEESTKNLATAYEFVTNKADDLSDRLRREADRVAELTQLEITRLNTAQRLKKRLAELEDIKQEHTSKKEDWEHLWHPLGITPRSPREMIQWSEDQRALVTQIASLQSQKLKNNALRKNIQKYREELNGALNAIGEEKADASETVLSLIDRANDIVMAKRKAIQVHEQLKVLLESLNTKDIPAAKMAVEETSLAFEEWQKDWRKVMEALGEDGDTSPGKAIAVIQEIDELLSAFDQAQEAKRRINEIDEDNREYRKRIEELVEDIAPDLTGVDAHQAIQKLHENLQKSISDCARMEELTKQREQEEERQQETDRTLTRVTEDLSNICREARVEDAAALPDAEQHSELRRQLESDLQGIDNQLIELSSAISLDDFLEIVENENPDTLSPAITQLEQEIQEKVSRRHPVSEEIGKLTKELQIMDGSAKAAQVEDEAQALLASMDTDVERYTRLRISELVLARAIEQYREKNQGPLLRRAGELFSKLTLGSFSNLVPDFNDKDEDILVGIRANSNDTVPISGMSEGTADQLYLALRLAGLELYLDKHQPIPFILDDILINFDDDRAIAVLKILADMSRRTQIIFFTHHQHLLGLAQKNIGEDVLFTHVLSHAQPQAAPSS